MTLYLVIIREIRTEHLQGSGTERPLTPRQTAFTGGRSRDLFQTAFSDVHIILRYSDWNNHIDTAISVTAVGKLIKSHERIILVRIGRLLLLFYGPCDDDDDMYDKP